MSTNFPTSLDSYTNFTDNVDNVMAAHINDPRDAIEALEAKVGVNNSSVTSSLDYKVNKFFTSGRKLYLYENTAPTGWSIVSACADGLLAVKGGSQAYNVSGGNRAGTWTQPNHTHTGPSHTHTGPSHNHQWYKTVAGAGTAGRTWNSGGTEVDLPQGDVKNGTVSAIGSETTQKDVGNSYTSKAGTGVTGASGTGNTSANATVNTWRPLANVGIIVQKS